MNFRPLCPGLAPVFFILSACAAPACGQERSSPTFVGENRATANRLAEARKYIKEQNWSIAIEQLQSILANAGNDLVSESASRSVSAGLLCRMQLAKLPAEALRLYRQRYENRAQKKFQTALAERDDAALRRLVEDSFCTRAAEKAIDLLGDRAFERGRFDEAEQWWRMLAPLPLPLSASTPKADKAGDAAARGVALVFPDLSLDSARLQAKQLLARLFADSSFVGRAIPASRNHLDATTDLPNGDWMSALDAYRRRFAKAEGTLAGRKGIYADTLLALAEARQKEAGADAADWSTFGGDPRRGRVIPASEDILDRLSSLCRDGPTWTIDLQRRARQEEMVTFPAVSAAQARNLAFHPIIVGHRVLVADARYVTAIDVRNGRSQQWYDAARLNGGVNPNLKLPAAAGLRYTLTVAGERLYARLGAQDIGLETPMPQRLGFEANPPRENETLLTCFDLKPDDKNEHFRWSDRGVVHANAMFEGAPLADRGRVWIATIRYQENRAVHAIHCYSEGDALKPPLWRHDVCETREIKMGEVRTRHDLLTLAGTQLVYCTHNGAVVAVDNETGRTNWAVRYPRRSMDRDVPELKDLSPVLFAAGRLYVAPADSDSLLCLDPTTGRTLWELEQVRVVHLLGVGQGRLIFTTPGGIRGVEADSGAPAWMAPDSGGTSLLDGLTPSGRGLLIGDLVLFPTARPRDPTSQIVETMVFALRQRDGRPADAPAALHRLPSGNMAYGNGILTVADRQKLFIFVPPRLLLNERQAAARRAPNSTEALLVLARAQEDAGQDEEAMRTFGRVEQRLGQNPTTTKEKKQLQTSYLGQQRLLLKSARRFAETERWDEAASALDRAASLPVSPRFRLHALATAASIWRAAKQMEREKAVWETIHKDETPPTIPIMDRQNRPVLEATRSAAIQGGDRAESLPSEKTHPEISALLYSRSWHVSLGNDESILEGDSDLLLIGTTRGRLDARDPANGTLRWSKQLPFAPRWATKNHSALVIAGAKGIASLRRENGKSIWHFPAPETSLYPRAAVDEWHVVLDSRRVEPLSSFQLKAGRLFFLQGQRRLFAINADSGSVMWDCYAPDALLGLPPPYGLFSPYYHVGAQTVLVQTTHRRWLFEAATGRRIHEASDGSELWQRPPLEVDERSVCVIPGKRHVESIDAKTGQTQWTYLSPGGTTLCGEPPSVLARDNVLLFLQPLNIGYSLIRLDRANGKPLWSHPQFLDAKALHPSDWTLDADTLYSIEDHELVARSLADGKIGWRRPLDGFARWRTQRIGSSLVVAPMGAIEWKWRLCLGREALCPVSFYDPKTGQLVQRLNFRIESLSSSEVSASKRKRSDLDPKVSLHGPHHFVAFGGDVWGLDASRAN
jgi:outer membrane protein assembly factor BamB